MSYYIVRDLKVVESPVGGYVLKYTVADSNCYTYNTSTGKEVRCEYTGTGYTPDEKNNYKHFTKEEIERDILVDYFKGNYHCGNNKYNNLCKKVGYWYDSKEHHPMLDVYFELDKKIDEIHEESRQLMKAIYSLERSLESSTLTNEQIEITNTSLRKLQDKEAELKKESSKIFNLKHEVLSNALYHLLYDHKAVREYANVKPFIIKDNCGRYVKKMNKSTYRYTYQKEDACVYTDKKMYSRYADGQHNLFTVEVLDK